ncbi:MAG: MBL fold metallo-hydrolase [Deltaproteobacteria bacterium]|nr:MBL fold metallo-hydrolase [Deltaproteobacteria bacterium]
MELSIIASGSNGNCYLVESNGTSVLFDAGKSYRETAQRMAALGKEIGEIDGIVLSHAHGDHYEGIGPIARRLHIPVYAREDVYAACRRKIGAVDVRHFSSGFRIKEMEITPVETSHDIASCGFVVGRFGLFTDTGCVTSEMREILPALDAVLLESNYDEEMLMNGPYPRHLKERIASERGHLSNDDASDFISRFGRHLSWVFLAHLSEKNNSAQKVRETFESLNADRPYVICSRFRETGTFALQER